MKIIADANIPFVQQCFSSLGEVEVLPGRKITPHSVRDADVLLVRSVTAVNSRLLSAGKVRFVGTATIGFEHVDVEYLQKNNIAFASAPGRTPIRLPSISSLLFFQWQTNCRLNWRVNPSQL